MWISHITNADLFSRTGLVVEVARSAPSPTPFITDATKKYFKHKFAFSGEFGSERL
jgi:hypothetical protein